MTVEELIEQEKQEKYEKWSKELENLNTRINNLGYWNDYAEMLQGQYDRLLAADPRLKEKKDRI